MQVILVATGGGCRVFAESGEMATELAGRRVSFLAPELGDKCLAIVDERAIWRRDARSAWSQIGKAEIPLQSLTSLNGVVFAGGLNEVVMLQVGDGGEMERLRGFDATLG